MDMFKPIVWGKESSGGGDGMGLDFRPLTWDAGMCPLANVHVDPRPYISSGEEVLGGSHTRMGKAMEVIKNGTLQVGWDIGAGGTSRQVTEEGDICGGERDPLEVQ